MRRRNFIASAAGGLLAAPLAGCTGNDGGDADADGGTETAGADGDQNLPDGVYVQSFVEEMAMQGTADAGDYRVGLMYAAPHQFWRMIGDERKETAVEDGDSLHLMALVWDPETGTVVPETGLSVAISKDGESFDEQVIYPMLSQSMGFHYGANFALDGDGEYDVRVDVGGLNLRRTGGFEGRFDAPGSATIGVTFDEETRQSVESRELDRYGERGAVQQMDMGMPLGVAPESDALPGDVIGTERTDDADLLALAVREDPPVGPGAYLALSARTPYNRYYLPGAAFEARLERDGETVFEGELERTIDPSLNYHYGAAVDAIRPGDELVVSTVTVPQVSRHEGYERAFLDMGEVSYTV